MDKQTQDLATWMSETAKGFEDHVARRKAEKRFELLFQIVIWSIFIGSFGTAIYFY